MGFCVKHIDEAFAYNLALALRIGNSCKFSEELSTCIYTYHIQPKALIVVKHILELILAEHSVIHKDAGEILAYSSIEKHCRYRRIHTSTQSEHHLVIAKLLLELCHGAFNK